MHGLLHLLILLQTLSQAAITVQLCIDVHATLNLQAVYHMPTQEEEMPSTSIPLALQSTFYKVQPPADWLPHPSSQTLQCRCLHWLITTQAWHSAA